MEGININFQINIKEDFQNLIFKWANDNVINYPWRIRRNPYRVLISEVLLIRTKAKQVVPVYLNFIKIFPSLEDLLTADISTIKEIIKSLGLLFRAEVIKEMTNQIKNDFNKKIPDNFIDLKKLKGIGDYSANAVLCFGYKMKRPLLDSNFIRIYKRVFDVSPRTKTAKTDKYLWNFSEALLPDNNFIKFNYAILDLGGKICISRKPKCNMCPLTNICFYLSNIMN